MYEIWHSVNPFTIVTDLTSNTLITIVKFTLFPYTTNKKKFLIGTESLCMTVISVYFVILQTQKEVLLDPLLPLPPILSSNRYLTIDTRDPLSMHHP